MNDTRKALTLEKEQAVQREIKEREHQLED